MFTLHGQAGAQKAKPVVAIYKIDDPAQSGQAATFSAMIETAIESTSKFRVIEREHLGKLMNEQAGARSGLLTTNTPGRSGGFEGADFLIYGSITSLQAVARRDIGSSLVAGFLSGNRRAPQCANTYATLGVDIKITDASSGEVRYVTHIDDTQKSAASCNGSAQVDQASLLRSAAEKVATGLVTSIYPIQVAAVQADGEYVLNYGAGSITPGAVMAVYQRGAAIRDPATGEVLSTDETKLGLLRVTEVGPRVSKAVPGSGFAAAAPVGSVVTLASAPDVQALSHPPRR